MSGNHRRKLFGDKLLGNSESRFRLASTTVTIPDIPDKSGRRASDLVERIHDGQTELL